ncbi:sterol carrier family protein [Tomitella biformata]|uniref:sterol carrier family protein n=1 Tax=Tomitella biformata TaxID=630403 RepID=UPI000467A362|nr:sterol carrier family protein [Tomitella biformata]
MSRKAPDPAAVRAAMLAIAPWLRDEVGAEAPARAELAEAVRLTARSLAAIAPGGSVEVRVPPFVAVQCVEGLRHTRGTPPNVVEVDPRSWLLLAAGLAEFDALAARGQVDASGSRASEIAHWLPIVPL